MNKTEYWKPLNIATKRYFYKPMAAFFNAFHLRAFYAADVRLKSPVLDIGCSDGEYGVLLAELLGAPDRMVGVDISSKAIASAGPKAGDIYEDMQVASGAQLPFDDHTFNTVVINASLTSIDPGLDRTLAEAYRVLKDGGMFYASVCTDQYEKMYWINRLLSRSGLHGAAERYRKSMNKRMQQTHLFPPARWIERIETCGFSVSDQFGFMPLSLVPFWSFLAWTPLRVHGVLKLVRWPLLHRVAENGYRKLFSRVYDQTSARLDPAESGYMFISAVKQPER